MKDRAHKPRILIVDDMAANLKLLRSHLSGQGYEVVSAQSGREALAAIDHQLPDLVLLDVVMPDMDGFEVCRRLKASTATDFVPVILVTALDEVEYKVRGMEAGADDFVTKPFNKVELLVRVKSLLRIKQLHDQLEHKVRALEEAEAKLHELAITDGLTGLYNYRYFKEQLVHEVDRAARHKESFSLIMLDIDHFKHYNDTHGHLAGDKVLKDLARLLRENVRKIDVAARYGGEEFALILVQTPHQASGVVARKLQALVQEFPFEHREQQPGGRLTISMGVATYPEDGTTAEELIAAADRRLYRAKAEGRNRVVMRD
ncbi:MAG: PleD family two-component system response regulator [candidate division KSB1 bacterium]|nr:PleD family two-component system response regulator [candidate division KSB1 bacterium]MDZ7377956.1 PleD family two-component system response regulator [candidate division KSB1 bacterium]MDZ7386873.1 PleD family two-component system response regulator [candidate division KSB1 bacterium]MDZ7391633.1 PleD family two-component system response regulator [candidate division KSB1 bacterium]